MHVLTLAVMAGTALMIDLRLMGVALRHLPASEVVARLRPWAAGGLAVMVASGALLFYAAPLARYQNLFFRLKMLVLAAAVAHAWAFQRTTYRGIGDWDTAATPPRRVRVAGALSLALWATVITLGRMMAYEQYWFD